MYYTNTVKATLFQVIEEISKTPELYVKNPDKDFTRKRKLSFDEMIKLILLMEGKSIRKELLEYFEFADDIATTSAFVQQRDKITPSAFEAVFHAFTNSFQQMKLFRGYRLLACDGSNLNTVPNPSDPQHHYNYIPNIQTYNMTHINGLFHILNRVYVDATIDPGFSIDERTALMTMMLRLQGDSPSILIADRGYMSYNMSAFAQDNNINYVIRVKDSVAKSLVNTLGFAYDTDFDYSLDIQLTCNNTKEIRAQKGCYEYLSQMNFMYYDEQEFYPIKFRVVRVPLGPDAYEYLFTNLPKEEFDMLTLKELYHLRWGNCLSRSEIRD